MRRRWQWRGGAFDFIWLMIWIWIGRWALSWGLGAVIGCGGSCVCPTPGQEIAYCTLYLPILLASAAAMVCRFLGGFGRWMWYLLTID